MLLVTASIAWAADARPWDLADGLAHGRPVLKTFDLPRADLRSWRTPLATIERAPIGLAPAIRRDRLEEALLSFGAELLVGSFPEEPWTRDSLHTRE